MREFFRSYLGVDPARAIAGIDWLLLPQQKLRSILVGPIYSDDLGLAMVRARLHFYPRDIWLHLLAVQWLRLAEDEAFVGRAGDVGDGLGARLLVARQVREMMRLEFLMERRYFPYDKWFGTAFRELRNSKRLLPHLLSALDAQTPRAREMALSRAYEILTRQQNSLRLCPPLPTHVSRFHNRPYLVIHAGEHAKAIRERIRNPRIRNLTRIGSVDQFAATEELGSHPEQLQALRALLLSGRLLSSVGRKRSVGGGKSAPA